MDLHKIPGHILENVRERGYSDEQIKAMSPERLFHEHCEWQGLIGFGRGLYNDVLALENAKGEAV